MNKAWRDFENILTKGRVQMELCLREMELAIAYTAVKEALAKTKNELEKLFIVKKRYEEIKIMTSEETEAAWIERHK